MFLTEVVSLDGVKTLIKK